MRTRDTVTYTLGMLLQQVVTFATAVVIARGLGPAAFGATSILKNVSAFLLILLPLGLDLGLLKHGALHAGSACLLQPLAIKLRCSVLAVNLAMLVATALLFGTLLQDVYQDVPLLWLYADISAFTLIFSSDLQVTGALFRVRDKLSTYVLVVLCAQPIIRFAATIAAIALRQGVLGIMVANALAAAATFALLQRYEPARVAPLRRVPQALRSGVPVGKILAETVWMALSMLAYQSMRFADTLILGAFAGVAASGQYSALSSVCQIIQIYPLAMAQMLGPNVATLYAAGRFGDIVAELRNYMRAASLFGGYVFGGVAIFGTDLDLMFGRSFHFSATLSLVLAAAYFISAIFAPLGYTLSMTGRHRGEFAILAAGSLMLVLLLVVLVPALGEIGAGGAVLAIMVIVNVARCVLVCQILRACPVGVRHALPPLIFLVLAAVCRSLPQSLALPRDVVTLCASCCIYTALCLLLYLVAFSTEGERSRLGRRVAALLRLEGLSTM